VIHLRHTKRGGYPRWGTGSSTHGVKKHRTWDEIEPMVRSLLAWGGLIAGYGAQSHHSWADPATSSGLSLSRNRWTYTHKAS